MLLFCQIKFAKQRHIDRDLGREGTIAWTHRMTSWHYKGVTIRELKVLVILTEFPYLTEMPYRPKIHWTKLKSIVIRISKTWNLLNRYLLQDINGIWSGLNSSHQDTLKPHVVENMYQLYHNSIRQAIINTIALLKNSMVSTNRSNCMLYIFHVNKPKDYQTRP